MADFTEEDVKPPTSSEEEEVTTSINEYLIEVAFDDPISVMYCGICSMPVELCEYGSSYDKCKVWLEEHADDETLAKVMESTTLDEEEEDEDSGKKKKKNKKVSAKVKKATVSIDDCKVVIARIQRQKRKFVTAVAGLESVPDLKLKDAAKTFGKKFSSGSSVSETASGAKEIVIQGDVQHDLPPLLMNVFKVPSSAIYFLEGKELVPYD